MSTAQPAPGTVTSRGRPAPRAFPEDYPLYATCDNCARGIRVSDPTADWVHTRDYRASC